MESRVNSSENLNSKDKFIFKILRLCYSNWDDIYSRLNCFGIFVKAINLYTTISSETFIKKEIDKFTGFNTDLTFNFPWSIVNKMLCLKASPDFYCTAIR